ncbi:MAG: LysM peptidoglycan-binding domain-containing protein, partial [Bacteroidetes bacterium]|nr:LysM peptidoglycan-binding domain-containing protein [Bacteroidota bacterium]
MGVSQTYLIGVGHIRLERIIKQFVAWMIVLLGGLLDSQLQGQVLRGNTNSQIQNTQRLDSNDASPRSFILPSNPKTLKFLDTSSNLIQSYQVSTIANILATYEARTTSGQTIMHIGDEQVSSLATGFHKGLMGNAATPGLFFPSTLANLSIPTDIYSSHSGLWTYATPSETNRLLPAGITGYVAQTSEAGSTITIQIPTHYQRVSDRFTLYCERSEMSFDIIVQTCSGRKSDGSPINPIKKEFPSGSAFRNGMESIDLTLPAGTKEILITCKKSRPTQQSFTLWGASLTNSAALQFHSIGMRGSGYSHLLRLEQFFEQLPVINPDIILLDFGLYDNYRAPESESIYLRPLKECLAKLKASVPSAKIVVCIPQDCIRGGRTLQTFEKFEQAVINLCKTEKCAYYDWFRVAGGKYSAQYWADYQLFKPDGLHLEEPGESLKTQCYASVFQQTQNRYVNGYHQFILPADSSKRLAFRTRDTLSKNVLVSEVWRYHVVRRGETAYRIALRYGITVAQLKEWNHLRNYNIAAGTRLKVGKISIATKSDPIQSVETKD